MEENAVLENTKTNVNDDNEHFICHQCHRNFKTHRGLMQHQRICKIVLHILRNDDQQVQRSDDAVSSQVKTHVNDNVIKVNEETNVESFYWNAIKGSEITRTINDIYDKIVYWRKNLFMLPNGSSGKNYIREITRLMNQWVGSPMKNISIKAIHIMPSILLQKP